MNIYLFIKSFVTSLRLAWLARCGNEHRLLERSKDTPLAHDTRYTEEQVIAAVNRALFIMRRFGFKYACYGRSVLVCYMLRWAGHDVRINFSVNRDSGHCWVAGVGVGEQSQDVLTTYP